MTHFADLIQTTIVTKTDDPTTDDAAFALPGRRQREAADRFSNLVTQHGFCLWSPHTMLKSPLIRIVIGVNTASRTDLTFLDEIQFLLSQIKAAGATVEVFNTYYFQTMEELQERIPGLENFFQTPAIGVWKNNEPTLISWGAQARQEFLTWTKSLAPSETGG